MRLSGVFLRSLLFPLVVGPVDGILTALTLSAGRMLTSAGRQIDMSLALRIALAASLSGSFVYFVAEYARLRGELIDGERHLNLASRGRFATSRLGTAVLRDAFQGAAISGVTGFLGALFPLALGALFVNRQWLTLVSAIVVLGALGIMVARSVLGRPLAWALALMATGMLLTAIGVVLDVT